MMDDQAPAEVVVREWESRAALRVDTAAKRFLDVERAAGEWFDGVAPLLAPVCVDPDDPNAIVIFEPAGYRPPVLDWANDFADGIHNLRAALDVLAMELAHMEGVPPTNERKIKFPITPDEKDWARVERDLSTIPKSIRDRLRDLQSWRYPDTIVPDFLDTLTAFDNDDKHRFGIEVRTLPLWTPDSQLSPLPEGAPDDIWSRPWMRAELTPPPSIAPQLMHIDIIPLVVTRGKIGHLFDVQRALTADTRRCMEFAATGKWPARPDLGEFMPDVPLLEESELPNMWRLAVQSSRLLSGDQND